MKKKIILKTSAALLVAALTLGTTAYMSEFSNFNYGIIAEAYSTGTYKVNTSSGVNVRSGAGTDYSKQGSAANGTSFTVDQISGSWGHTNSIQCTNGTKSGWVCLSYCTQTSSSNPASSFTAGKYKVYNCSALNVRTGPGTDYSVKTSVSCGTYLNITSKSGNWGYAQNLGGYVSMSYCSYVGSWDNDNYYNYVTPLSNGTAYYIAPACATSNRLDVSGGGTGNCTNIISWSYHGGKNQQFKAVYISNGYYTFQDVNSGKVIDVSGGRVADGTNVQIYQYNGTASQLWRMIDVGNGYYSLQSKLNSSYYLDVNGASSSNGANIQLWKGNSSNAQKFKFTAVSSPPPSNNTSLGITSYSSDYRNSRYYSNLVNSRRTGANRSSVVNIALSQVGYHEGSLAGTGYGSNNKCEYNRWYYNSNNAYGGDYAWCAVFVNWCMREANISYSIYPGNYSKSGIYAEGVASVRRWFENRGRYYSSYSYTPKVGDVAIFTNSGHIGIVADVSGSGRNARVTIVEGNCSDSVQKNTYTNYGSRLIGYCIPNY